MIEQLRASPHFLSVRQPKGVEHHLNSMQPVVPERGLPNIVASGGTQSLSIGVQLRKDTANIGSIKWQVNDCIWPIKLPLEYVAARRLPQHHCTCCGTFVETRRDLIAPCRELGSIDKAAIGNEVAAMFE